MLVLHDVRAPRLTAATASAVILASLLLSGCSSQESRAADRTMDNLEAYIAEFQDRLGAADSTSDLVAEMQDEVQDDSERRASPGVHVLSVSGGGSLEVEVVSVGRDEGGGLRSQVNHHTCALIAGEIGVPSAVRAERVPCPGDSVHGTEGSELRNWPQMRPLIDEWTAPREPCWGTSGNCPGG